MKKISNLSRFESVQRRMLGSLAIFCLVLIAGTFGYKLLGPPDESWLDAFYMTFLMVGTIGYGAGLEVYRHPGLELFTVFIVLAGIANMTFFFSMATAWIIEYDTDPNRRNKIMLNAIEKLYCHYVICGYGKAGERCAKELQNNGYSFVAIDPDEHKLSAAEADGPLLHIKGDASDEDTLRKAGASRASGIFAVTNDDSKNLLITLEARELNPDCRIVARAGDPRNAPRLRKAGADEVVYPDSASGSRLASAMLTPYAHSFVEELATRNRSAFCEVQIPDNGPANVAEAIRSQGQRSYLIALLHQGRWIMRPDMQSPLCPRDILIFLNVDPAVALNASASPPNLPQKPQSAKAGAFKSFLARFAPGGKPRA